VGEYDEVEVRLRFDGRWVGGFEIVGVHGSGPEREVWLRRRSDGAVLPSPFAGDEVRRLGPSRPARRRAG
jgi:hypothetical protein